MISIDEKDKDKIEKVINEDKKESLNPADYEYSELLGMEGNKVIKYVGNKKLKNES